MMSFAGGEVDTVGVVNPYDKAAVDSATVFRRFFGKADKPTTTGRKACAHSAALARKQSDDPSLRLHGVPIWRKPGLRHDDRESRPVTVAVRRTLQLGCFAFALTVSAANADRTLQLSTEHLVAEGPTVTVTHDHDVKRIERPGFDPGLFLLDLSSTLRIVRKRDQVEIFRQDVMPFTA